MTRRVRRVLVLLALIGLVAELARRALAARRPLVPPAPPTWPPLPRSPRPQPRAAGSRARWTTPVDGGCPVEFPIKANDRSRIFHVPGGRSYARTVPQRCYASPDDAAADGYRAAKA